MEKEILNDIERATKFRQSQRDAEYIDNQAHYEGIYWNIASYGDNSPFMLKSDINHVKNAIDIRLASLFTNDYSGELKSKSPDDKDAIEILNIIYKNEWNRLKMDEMIKKILKDAAVLGEGYLQLSYDTDKIEGGTNTRNEGFIKVNYIHTSTVYIDPSATSCEDADFILFKTRRTKQWIERNKPKWLDKIKDGAGFTNGQDDGEIYLAGRDYSKEQENILVLNTLCKKVTITKNGVTGTKIKIFYVINDIIVETNDKYPFDFFDIEKLTCEEIPQTPYGVPLMRGLTIPQKVANLIESSINNVAMHYTVPTWLVSEDSTIDIDEFSKFQSALGVVWKVAGDPTKAVSQLAYPRVDEQLVNYANMYVQYIRRYAGVNDQYTGDIGSAGNTSSGTIAAINRAIAIDSLLVSQIEKFVENFSKKLIKYIFKYYKGKKIWIRKDDGEKYYFKDYMIDEGIENVDFDINIDLVYKTKNDKDRQYNELKQIYQLQNQYKDPTPLIKSLDLVKAAQLDDYKDLFNRNMNMSEEAMSEKAELMLQLLPALSMTDVNGIPIVTPEEFQQGIIDILNDDNDLTFAEGIITKMEEYQNGGMVNESNNEGV